MNLQVGGIELRLLGPLEFGGMTGTRRGHRALLAPTLGHTTTKLSPTPPAVRDRRASPKVARDTTPLRWTRRKVPPVDKSPEVIDRSRLAPAPVTDEGIALEDRGSKLLARGADVHAPALVAIRDASRTAAFRERPVSRTQPQDRHAPSVIASPPAYRASSSVTIPGSRATCGSWSGSSRRAG